MKYPKYFIRKDNKNYTEVSVEEYHKEAEACGIPPNSILFHHAYPETVPGIGILHREISGIICKTAEEVEQLIIEEKEEQGDNKISILMHKIWLKFKRFWIESAKESSKWPRPPTG